MKNHQQGVSLISLMVGIFISMLLLLVAMGTFSFFEANRRTLIGTDSAVQEGLSGLMDIQREAANAGVGLRFKSQATCLTLNAYRKVSGTKTVITNNVPIGPVLITAGATAKASDAVTFFSMGNSTAGAASQLTATPANAVAAPTVYSGIGFTVGKFAMLATPGSTAPCTLMQVTGIADAATGGSTLARATNDYNSGSTAGFSNPQTYSDQSVAFALSAAPAWHTYQVTGNQLSVVDNLTGDTSTIASNVVMLRAYYGVSTAGDAAINEWVAATGAWAGPFTAAQVSRIRAVRLVVVTRSPQPEKPAADGTCSTTTTAPTSWTGGPTLDLSGLPNWRCYRYKTFTTVAPLTNVLFGGA